MTTKLQKNSNCAWKKILIYLANFAKQLKSNIYIEIAITSYSSSLKSTYLYVYCIILIYIII